MFVVSVLLSGHGWMIRAFASIRYTLILVKMENGSASNSTQNPSKF